MEESIRTKLIRAGYAISPDSKTDWEYVMRMAESDAPIPYDPEDGPYDPNDDAAVEAYWDAATVIYGPGWQTRIDETLKRATEAK